MAITSNCPLLLLTVCLLCGIGQGEYKFIPHMGVIFHDMGKRLPVAPSFTEVVFRIKTFPRVEHDPIDSIWFCSVEVRDRAIKCLPGQQEPCYHRTNLNRLHFQMHQSIFHPFFIQNYKGDLAIVIEVSEHMLLVWLVMHCSQI